MKQKAAVRYLLHSYRNPILIFYGIILLVSLLIYTVIEVQVAGEGKVSSVNGASVIFLFVCGLNAFKEDFCFLLQNGVSRKTQFSATCIAFLPVALLMAFVDSLMTALFSALFSYQGILGLIYGRAMEAGFTGFLLQIGWLFCLYLFALLLGYFITTLYYRMDSKVKVLVSVSVPVLFALVLPLMDTELFHGRISQSLLAALKAVFGLQNNGGSKPFFGMLFLLICCAACGICARGLQRKAILK